MGPAQAITKAKACEGVGRDVSGRPFGEREKDHPTLVHTRREAQRGHGVSGMAGTCDESS